MIHYHLKHVFKNLSMSPPAEFDGHGRESLQPRICFLRPQKPIP